MTEKQLKELIREEYHNVKNFMEEKYGFTPDLGKVIDNPYVSAFKVEDYLEEDSSITESIRVGKVVTIKKYNPKTNRYERADVKITDYIKKPGSKDFVEYEVKGQKRKVAITVFKSMMESLSEELRPDEVEFIIKKLGNSMPNHTSYDYDKGPTDAQVLKALKKYHRDYFRHSTTNQKKEIVKGIQKYLTESTDEALSDYEKKGAKYDKIYKSYKYKKKSKKKNEGDESDSDMAVDQMETMVKRAQELITKLRGKGDLEPWVQSLITKAEDYISTVSDYGEVVESKLKGQLAGDSVQDIIKSIGSRFVSGEIKNTKRDGKTYIKLKDEKFGSGVVKILKSRFGIDATVDYYGGKGKIVSTPSVSFFSDTIIDEVIEEYDVETIEETRDFINFMKEYKSNINEAEYQGRDVKLGKIMQGDVKKFKVYVKNDKGNVVKVNFGQGGDAKGGTMRIRKDNPEARKSFRARHNCDNPGPRWKARYWSCRKW